MAFCGNRAGFETGKGKQMKHYHHLGNAIKAALRSIRENRYMGIQYAGGLGWSLYNTEHGASEGFRPEFFVLMTDKMHVPMTIALNEDATLARDSLLGDPDDGNWFKHCLNV